MRTLFFTIVCIFLFTSARGQKPNSKLDITPLTGNFYIYTTYNEYQGSKTPAHGMYLVTKKGVVLFDTPWDTTQFQPLLDSIQKRHNKKVLFCLATHWHSDRTAGLEYYEWQGIKTYTTALTDQWSKKENAKRAAHLIYRDTVFHFDEYSFETYYPGEGHTADNIVVWFGKEKILYGGCLIKGADAENLGYLGDGNTKAYETTLLNVQKKYTNPKYIIVSHANWKNNKSLKHSIELAKDLKKAKGN